MNNDTFNRENDELLQFVLDARYFNIYKEPLTAKNKNIAQLELFITSYCNLKCTYCYLNKYRDKLSPNAKKTDVILNNLRILLDHFLKEGYSFTDIDLFSGEIWGDPLGNGVIDLLEEYIKKGLVIKNIMVPTNFTFILYPEKTELVEGYIKRMSDIGTCLQLSASIDGKMLEDETRPFKANGKTRDDEYYDKVFSFCKKYGFLFHPMVAAHGIEKWVDNYNWYMDMLEKHGFENPMDCAMMLEVRNDDWTPEAIQEYLKFIDYLINYRFKKLGNSVKEFATFLFNLDQRVASGYLPYTIPLSENIMPCTVQNQLTVRLGDLALVPCHRMAYDNFVFGKYRVENEEIVGIEAINPQMAVKVMLSNPSNSIHGCDNCTYNKMCMKGCFGAQFEYGEELFMPLKSVCNLFKAKYDFLLDRYAQMGVFEEIEKLIEEDRSKVYLKDTLNVYYDIMSRRNQQCWDC